MARKRHGNQQRQRSPFGSERSYLEYQLSAPFQAISRQEIVRMLRGGEDTYLELKVRFSNVEKITAEIIALANTDGGALVFGVNDQLRIEGIDDVEDVEEQLRDICLHQIQPPVFPYLNKVAFDSGRRIVILEVNGGNRPHRTRDDRFYLREGATKRETTREELSRLMQETHLTRFEQMPVLPAQLERDIDEALVWSYVRAVNPGYWGGSSKGFPTDGVLRDMGLATKLGEEIVPTVGGLLLFGWNERLPLLLPQAAVTLTRLSGNDHHAPIIERLSLQGNLVRLWDGALGFIKRYIDLHDARPSRRALDEAQAQHALTAAQAPDQFAQGRASYHRGAMIEAVTNFLIHRDWSARDRQARINIYDDSLELINAAQVPELPIISLRYGVAAPFNPRVKAIFTNQHYGVETSRGGIPMICAEAISFARRAPEGPAIANGEFRLKLYGVR